MERRVRGSSSPASCKVFGADSEGRERRGKKGRERGGGGGVNGSKS